MTTGVHAAKPGHNLAVAEEIMVWAKIRHVPVVDDDNRLVGLVTRTDLLQASVDLINGCSPEIEKRQQLTSIPIATVMRQQVTTIDPDATIQAAARVMYRHKFGCLPVVNQRNELLGILSSIDLLRVVMELDPKTAADLLQR